jgi:hypothetical protein
MQNDTISRSALVAELECYKMSLGDIVLRFVVDRVIEIVKAAHKAPEEAPPEQPAKVLPNWEDKHCITCRYAKRIHSVEPCESCIASGSKRYWEPRS